MPAPSSLRDSTQIVLPVGTLEGARDDVEAKFAVTVHESEDMARIIGSPVAIKDVNDYLTRQGVALP